MALKNFAQSWESWSILQSVQTEQRRLQISFKEALQCYVFGQVFITHTPVLGIKKGEKRMQTPAFKHEENHDGYLSFSLLHYVLKLRG